MAITPVPREAGRHTLGAVHQQLRKLILDGTLAPGSLLNQVELAPQLGVSRTPLREAIRMLQEEGLVVAEPQRRARVVGFDPGFLEAVYTQRILLESLAARLTAEHADEACVARLDRLLDEMAGAAPERDVNAWREAHRRFHLELVAGAGAKLIKAIAAHMDHGEYYRVLYEATGPRAWTTGEREHRAIVDTYRRRDGRAAAAELASHLARTALSLMAQLSPAYDPAAIRVALAAMAGSATDSPDGGRSPAA